MKNFALKIIQAIIMSVFALVVLLNSELSQMKYESSAKNLGPDTRIGLAKPVR